MLGSKGKRYMLIYPDEISVNFVRSIKKRRLEMGLTQAELGARVRVNEETIWNYEVGRNLPTLRVFNRLAKFFKADVSDSINWQVYNGQFSVGALKRAIERLHMSVDELSKLCHIAPSRIKSAIRGDKDGSLCTLGRVVDIVRHEREMRRKRCR